MDYATLFVQFLQVILSWPVIVGVCVWKVFAGLLPEFKRLISRIHTTTFKYGMGEFSTSSQIDKSREEAVPATPSVVPGPSKSEEVAEQKKWSFSDDEWQKVRALFQAERANARLWEYRFLNTYLVYKTQQILDWLAACNCPPTVELFHSLFPGIHFDERKIIIYVLQSHFLIEIKDQLITVTEKGREYIAWRGPVIPATPA